MCLFGESQTGCVGNATISASTPQLVAVSWGIQPFCAISKTLQRIKDVASFHFLFYYRRWLISTAEIAFEPALVGAVSAWGHFHWEQKELFDLIIGGHKHVLHIEQRTYMSGASRPSTQSPLQTWSVQLLAQNLSPYNRTIAGTGSWMGWFFSVFWQTWCSGFFIFHMSCMSSDFRPKWPEVNHPAIDCLFV